MATKHWKVSIRELGASSSLYDDVVEAPTWIAALQRARAEIGDEGGLPAGASCNMAPSGLVTVQDARARRRYLLEPSAAPEPSPSAKKPSADVQTETSSNGVWTSGRMPPRSQSAPPPPVAAESKLVLLATREQEPSQSSPLHFREKMYAVHGTMAASAAEKLATKLLRQVRGELEGVRGAKFVRIEVFDHVWQSRPERPPTVRVEWKDWSKSIDIEFPLKDQARKLPELPDELPAEPIPLSRERLSVAFDACKDLLFLRTRAEALGFAVHLIEELVPCEATAAFLLDINNDEFRVVAARGAGARERQGTGLPSSTGLLGAASALTEHAVLVLSHAKKDPRFREEVDGVPGLDVRSMLYRPLIHNGRLFGVLQLANGAGRGMFNEGDCEVVDYITQQLSEFVAQGAARKAAG